MSPFILVILGLLAAVAFSALILGFLGYALFYSINKNKSVNIEINNFSLQQVQIKLNQYLARYQPLQTISLEGNLVIDGIANLENMDANQYGYTYLTLQINSQTPVISAASFYNIAYSNQQFKAFLCARINNITMTGETTENTTVFYQNGMLLCQIISDNNGNSFVYDKSGSIMFYTNRKKFQTKSTPHIPGNTQWVDQNKNYIIHNYGLFTDSALQNQVVNISRGYGREGHSDKKFFSVTAENRILFRPTEKNNSESTFIHFLDSSLDQEKKLAAIAVLLFDKMCTL